MVSIAKRCLPFFAFVELTLNKGGAKRRLYLFGFNVLSKALIAIKKAILVFPLPSALETLKLPY
jgi:hypothetical protein